MFNLRDPDEEDRADRLESERRAEREREHTPVERAPGPSGTPSPKITSAMAALAWTVLHGSWHDARDASRALASIILEAMEC